MSDSYIVKLKSLTGTEVLALAEQQFPSEIYDMIISATINTKISTTEAAMMVPIGWHQDFLSRMRTIHTYHNLEIEVTAGLARLW